MVRGDFARLRLISSLLASLAIAGCGQFELTEQAKPSPQSEDMAETGRDRRPNVLLIVVDDMGMADLGAFGGEIDTPNLDALAFSGIRLTNFHASPVCSVTRAMLLTGVDAHKAGLGNMAEEVSPNQEGKPGYEGYLNDRVTPISAILKEHGYNTYLSGKWHLGATLETSPWARGFDHSFALLSGAASHFADMSPAYDTDPNAKAPYRRDKDLLSKLPDNFQYSTQFYVDQMISYIDADAGSGKPFFAYLALTAPHWPLQAPDQALAKYKGKYDAGFDALRADRLRRQIELGIVPANSHENAPSRKAANWIELTPNQKAVEERAMEVYAAMVDQVDVHVGRLIDHLRKKGMLENTIVIFLSDNGAEGHDLDDTFPADLFPEMRANIDDRHDFSFENMGRLNSYVLYGPNWARAGAPTLRLFKGFPTEGGTRVPAFIHYSGFLSDEISDRFFTVQDIAPTLLDLLSLKSPATGDNGETLEKISGTSMVKALTSREELHANPDRIDGGEVFGKYYIRKGRWKMINVSKPEGVGDWQLYDIEADPSESADLADKLPEIKAELIDEWDRYSKDNNIVLPDKVSGY